MASPAFDRVERFVRTELVDWYQSRGHLAFGYAAGSLVEEFTDDADLDLTLVWSAESSPPAEGRLPLRLADTEPVPVVFEQPNFNLDRFWFDTQQFDIKHVSLREFRSYVEEVEDGGGVAGYPMPAILLHGLSTGIVVFDADGLADEFRSRLMPASERYVTAATTRWASSRASYLGELRKCMERGDGLLFHHLAVEAARTAFISWFARLGLYWPHEKRLGARLDRMGHGDLATLEARVWTSPGLKERYAAMDALFRALDA